MPSGARSSEAREIQASDVRTGRKTKQPVSRAMITVTTFGYGLTLAVIVLFMLSDVTSRL